MYIIRQINHITGERRTLESPIFHFTDEVAAERMAVRLTFCGPSRMSYVVRYAVQA